MDNYCFLLVFYSISGNLNLKLKNLDINVVLLDVIKIIELIVGVLSLALTIVQALLPQKVELFEKTINVYRHTVSIFGFNDTILIKNIERVYLSENKNYNLVKSIPVGVVDWDNLVVIKMQTGRRLFYCVPIENSEEFIEEVNKRRMKLQEKDNIDELSN